jgi:protein-disulfide isomerase
MTSRFGIAICACAAFVAAGAATAATPRGGHKTPKSATCFGGFPQGVFHKSPYETTSADLSIDVTAPDTIKDPSLARDKLPALMAAAMNDVSPSAQFTVADGSSGIFAIHLTISQDAAQTHFGATIVVSGPTAPNFIVFGATQPKNIVEYFEFTLPPQYATADQLIKDASVKIATNLENGWTCD